MAVVGLLLCSGRPSPLSPEVKAVNRSGVIVSPAVL